MSTCSTIIPMWDLHQVHYYPQCQLISAISLHLMRSDRSPTARTPLCLLIGQPDGQFSSRGGTWYQCQQSDLTLQEQLYVCIWKWGRTVPKDCREHMCWWRPERVLKWRLMNERPEWAHVCVWMKLKGQWNVRHRENKLELLFTQCARACVCVCVVKCSYSVSFRFVTWCPTWGCRLTKFHTVQHNVMHLLCKWIELNCIFLMNLTPYLPCFCLYLDDKCLILDKDSCLFTGLKLETNKKKITKCI